MADWGILNPIRGCPEADLWDDTLALIEELLDSLAWVVPPNFNMVGGLGPLHIVGLAGLGPLSSGSLRIMILTIRVPLVTKALTMFFILAACPI